MSDPPATDGGDGDEASYGRRTVLRAAGATAATVATSGVAAAQNETGTEQTGDETPSPSPIITMGVTLEQENIEGGLTGMWIHVGRPVEPVQASIADQCDAVDWGDQDTLAYDVTLLDRAVDPYQQSTTLYLPRSTEVGGGDLFIVNDTESCRSGYVGVQLEQIGARNIDVGVDAGQGLTETELDEDGGAAGGAEGPSGGIGPGFGALAGAGGLLGGGWLLNRSDGDDRE